MNAFPGLHYNLYSSRFVTHHNVRQDLQDSPVQEYFVPKLTYQFCPTVAPAHHFNLKNRIPDMSFETSHTWVLGMLMCSLRIHWRKEWFQSHLKTAMEMNPNKFYHMESRFSYVSITWKLPPCSFYFFSHSLEQFEMTRTSTEVGGTGSLFKVSAW